MPFAPSSPIRVTSLRLPGQGSLTWLWLASLVLAGCNAGDGLVLPGDGNPATIRVVQGNGQSGRVGESLADPVVVKVTDSRGHPVQNVTVAFELTDAGPGADIDPETATTGSNGEADTRMRLGTRMGPQTGEARVVTEGTQEPTASFTVTALSENADGMSAASGDDQSGPVGSILPEPLVVLVTDAFGNPISGVPISWTAGGGGSVSETLVSTDAQGRASVERQLGPAAGPQTTVASSEGLAGSPVTFTHTATAGNASGLSILSGNNQTGEVGRRLPADLVVRLLDADGNGVSNTAVTWVVATGGGSVTPENGITDDAGRSSAQWTLGPNPGENRVDAVVSGVGFVTFRATGTRAGPTPTVTTITSDAPDPSVAGSVITVNFQVTSSAGVPAGNVTVSVSGATPPPPCTVTLSNGTGSCQFTLSVVGNRTFTAVYAGGSGFAGSQDAEPHAVVPANPSNRAPDADYNWHCEGLTCAFNDASSDPDGQVSGWSWNFGDGRPGSNERNPSHTFPGPGEYQVTLTVTDNGGATDQSTAGVEVEAPGPGGTTTTITGDGPDPSAPGAAITVSFTVTSPSGTPTGNVQVSDGIGGSCTGNAASGSCSYTPGGTGTRTITAMYLGNSSFSGSSDTEPHTVSAPNQPPVAGNDAATTDAGTPVTINVLANDNDPEGDGLTITSVSDPANGSAVNNGNGTITYTPDPGFGGADDSFTYVVSDGALTDDATVTVTVNAPPPPPNQPPVAGNDAASTDAGTPVTINVLANDNDPDGDGLTITNVSDPANGSAVNNGNGTITYTPDPGFGGADDSFTYVVSDGALTDDATVTVTVNAPPPPPNEAPSFSLSNSSLSANMGESRTEAGWAENITPGPPSESGQVVTFLVEANPSDLFTVPPSISQDGTLTFTTSTGEGDSVVTVRLQDNGGTANGGVDTSDPQTFTIHISGGGGD